MSRTQLIISQFLHKSVVNWKEMETTEITDSDSSPPKEHNLNIDISSSPLHKMKVYQQPLGA